MSSEDVHKLRRATVEELACKIRDKAGADNRPRFSFFLGAGASVASGIPGTVGMIRDFKKALSERRSPNEAEIPLEQWLAQQPWYQAPGSEYSKLFEAYEPKPRGRQQYIERLIEGKRPSCGYFFLANLIRDRYIDNIITTNFDDLVYAACTLWTDIRPVVYAYGIMATEMLFSAKRPKITKLHGDFLYSRLRNTNAEMGSPDPNMARQVTQLFQEQGLVVVGYGGNDDSVHEILDSFPEDNDLYWCVMRGQQPNLKVQDLLYRKAGFLVEIDGFDRLFDDILVCAGYRFPAIEEEVQRRRNELVESIRSLNSPNLSRYLGEVTKVLDAEVTAPAKERRERQSLAATTALRGFEAYNAGRVKDAIPYYEQALAIARETGDRQSEGIHLGNLGNAYLDLGEVARAIDYYEQALAIARETGNRRHEGVILGNLGTALFAFRKPEAAAIFPDAVAALREVLAKNPQDPMARYCLGSALLGAGAVDEGLETLREALRSAPLKGVIGNVLTNLVLLKGLPGVPEAIALLETALKGQEPP